MGGGGYKVKYSVVGGQEIEDRIQETEDRIQETEFRRWGFGH